MRLLVSVVGLPLAILSNSLLPAITIIALADAPRAALLNWFAYREKVSFILQEMSFLLIVVGSAIGCRWLVVTFGLADGMVSSIQWDGLSQLTDFRSMI